MSDLPWARRGAAIALHIIVAAFAGWRIASLLVNESGPWNLFLRLRQRLGAEDDGVFFDTAPFWHGLFSCVWCAAIWTTPPMWGLYYVAPWLPGIIAAMALAVVVEQWVRR